MSARVFGPFVLLAFAPACTAIIGLEDLPARSSIGGGPVTTGDAQHDTVLNAVATALCRQERACGGSDFDLLYADLSSCIAQSNEALQWNASLPGSAFTKEQLSGCAAKIDALTCVQLQTGQIDLNCGIRGARKIGEACLSASQCETSFCGAAPFTCGVCVAVPQQGSACTPAAGCAAGTVCNSSRICVVPADAGDPCSPDAPCALPNDCDQATGTCRLLPASQGAYCEGDVAGCDLRKGFFCVESECRRFTVSGPGEACVFTETSASLCRLNAVCSPDAVCGDIAKAGDLCGPGTGDNILCPRPLTCVDGVCKGLPSAASCL